MRRTRQEEAGQALEERLRDLERREREVERREKELGLISEGRVTPSPSPASPSEDSPGLITPDRSLFSAAANRLEVGEESNPAADLSDRLEVGEESDADNLTLVGSDFTDQWFQDQADSYSFSVKEWLADQVGYKDQQTQSSAGARGQKRKVSDRLNKDEGQGDSFEFDVNGNAVSSHQFNHPRAPNTEGEQNASEDGVLIAHAPNGPVAGGGGGPGRPARAGCTRNGQNARASKKHKTSHCALSGEEGEDDDDEEEEDLEEEDEEEEEEEGAEGGRRDEEVSGWLVSEVPAASSKEVRNAATLLLLEIALGEGTQADSDTCDSWIERLLQAISVKPWEDEERGVSDKYGCH
ncbi:hypothetical protein C8R42DRAFT_648704 [Lentinula raphanica]|nr:hypothetical protein C8R42DRAFT_648704 [Lentinula raphanica]